MSAALARLIWRFRYPACATILLGFIALAPSTNFTELDNDISAWISKEDPVYQTYERFRREFGGGRTLIIALKSDRLFTPPSLEFIRSVTRDIERIEHVQRVQSLATANIVRALPPADAEEGGGLEIQPLLDEVATPAAADAARRRALDDHLLRGDLVSEDGTTTAIFVTFDEDRIDEVRGAVVDKVHQTVDSRLPHGMEAFYNGSLEISEAYNRVTIQNTRELTPPILLVMILGVYAMFRSWRTTGVVVVSVLVSVVWTMGLYALMGFKYNVLASMMPALVIVLAIADDIHIVQHFVHDLRETGDKRQAFVSSIEHLFAPLLGASVTTALGLLSLATSEVHAVRTFGIGAATGVMVDFVMSLVFVPTLLTLIKPDTAPPPQERWLVEPMRAVARFSIGHARIVVIVALAAAVLATTGVSRLRVDTNHINFFAEKHPLSRSAAVMDRDLSGIYSFNILLEGPPDSLKSPDALQRIERLRQQLERLPFVRKVVSVADYVKRVNRELNGGNVSAAVVPASGDAIAQELFLFGLSDDGRLELERMVASDYSRAQISVKLASMSSDLVFEQINEADGLAAAAFAGSGITPTVTGSGHIFATLDHYIVVSQLSSFATAFITVFIVIFIVFRSARFGFLGIVANAVPVLAVLGLMGWLDISLNVATVMVASVALGIVDDDTIHFINRYRRERASGADSAEAIEMASVHEGRASLTTALINSLGFGLMMFVDYKPTAWFGGLLALTMAVAFLAEVFVVPAVITMLPKVYGGRAAGAVTLILLFAAPAAQAQDYDGYVSTLIGVMPDVSAENGRQSIGELRTRLFAEGLFSPAQRWHIRTGVFVDALLADRGILGGNGLSTAAVIRPADLYLEFRGTAFDVRAGISRIVWGRLDEFQPTDVVNPVDLSRFVFEGRSEARLPVALVRGRAFLPRSSTLEGIIVPAFRAGRFDQLDEETSPFRLAPPGAIERQEPGASWSNVQGGARFTSTIARVDWGVSAWRGFEHFPGYEPTPAGYLALFPRFTMVGADFETVRGPWGVRGELAWFDSISPRSFEGGIGADRRAGSYRVAVNAVVSRADDTDLSLVGFAERSFARETRNARLLAVYDPSDDTAFVRGIGSWSIRDNVTAEASAGFLTGSAEAGAQSGIDVLALLSRRDFLYVRLKVHF